MLQGQDQWGLTLGQSLRQKLPRDACLAAIEWRPRRAGTLTAQNADLQIHRQSLVRVAAAYP